MRSLTSACQRIRNWPMKLGRDRELRPGPVLDHHPLGIGENDLVKVALRRGRRERKDSPGRQVRPGPAKVLRPDRGPGTNTAAASAQAHQSEPHPRARGSFIGRPSESRTLPAPPAQRGLGVASWMIVAYAPEAIEVRNRSQVGDSRFGNVRNVQGGTARRRPGRQSRVLSLRRHRCCRTLERGFMGQGMIWTAERVSGGHQPLRTLGVP